MNGAAEATNKNIKKILVKMIDTYKDWHEFLPFALCAYRTSIHTSMGATLYSLVYSMEVVLPPPPPGHRGRDPISQDLVTDLTVRS